MAYKRNLVLALVLNILIKTQCQSEIEYNDSQILAQDQENDEGYKVKPSIVAQFDTDTIVDYEEEHNTSQDNTEKNVDSTVTTEESVDEEHVEDYAVEREERVRTTVQYVTEASTGFMDNIVYNRDNAGREAYPATANSRQSDIYLTTTTQATLLAADSDELRTQSDEQQDMGQRSPKTEADSKEQTEKWGLEKPRPTVALSRSSTLKSWLEDTWLRPPAGIMVPLRPSALSRALGVWNDLIDEGLNMTDIVIVGYDTNGVNWRSRHNLQPSHTGSGERTVSEALSKLLLKYQDVYTDTSNDGTMRALMLAAKLVPYDSALFLITDKGAGDPQKLSLALRALIEKRLKVYTIWTDPSYPSAASEQALQDLKNVSSHTDGEVLPYSMQLMDEENADNFEPEAELQQWEPLEQTQSRHARLQQHPEVKFDTLLVKRAAGEAISLGLPVENGVTALRIYIEGNVEHAIIYPPNDEPQIDLNNVTSVLSFSSASTTVSLHPREVHLVFPGANEDTLSVLPASPSDEILSRMVGVWHLSVRCDTCEYRIRVDARTRIHLNAEVHQRDTLQLRLTGPVASVRESSLVDETGMEQAKLSFSYQPSDSDGAMANIMTEVSMPKISSTKVYVKIVGRDNKGEPFVRLAGPFNPQTEIRLGRSATIRFPESDLEQAEAFDSWMYNRLQYNDSNILPFGRASSQVLNQAGSILTSVQIGLSSKLYGAPGERLQLHFEVTNYRDQQQRFDFGAVGELRFLTGITPVSQTVQSGQTVNVIVSLTITSTAQPGARDLITFTAYAQGREQVSMSAYVYVMNSGDSLRDVWAPEIRHNFGGSCMGRLGNDCAEHTWSATVIARDAVGGLLRLTSVPLGLVYDSNFISGTREEVIANYRSTCCSPRVVVNAVDAFGNTNSYVIDITNTLQLRLTGPVASVRESSLVDETGMEQAKLSFSYQPSDSDGAMANIMTEVSMPKISSTKVYVKIVGRDNKGEPFVRLAGPFNPQTEIRLGRSATIRFPESDLEQAEAFDSWMYNRLQYNDSNILPFGRASSQVLNQAGSILTSVQIGLSSKLYGAPGERLQLHFEVTNYRDQQQRFDFGAVGELRFLTGITPTSQTVQSGQTVNVIVSLTIASTAQPGARDLITFTAYAQGREQVSMSAYVYVMNSGDSLRDVWAPEIRHNFGGSCMGRLGNDCAEHTWSATVIARDAVGGLLRLTSVPLGLVYDSNFISGTREEVIANYRSTCCSPRVVVNAVDAFGNTNSYVIDITNYITGAGIAAIVLAVVLLIVLIISVVFCVYWCVKRRRESKELSSYGTSRNIS